MLTIKDQEYLDEVKAFAEKIGKGAELEDRLNWLKNYAGGKGNCEIYKDFAPYSFAFVMYHKDGKPWFNGGLIFHGPHDGFGSGGMPSLSVSLSNHHGWEIHT